MASEYNYSFTGKLAPDCLSIIIDNGPSIARILYPIKDDQLEISLKKFYRQRTLAQNNWVHGPCIATIQGWMRERTGACPSHDALYAYLRLVVVGEEAVIEDIDGVDVVVIKGKHFSQCTTKEFAERVDKIVAFYAARELVIPLPQAKTNNFISDFSQYMK